MSQDWVKLGKIAKGSDPMGDRSAELGLAGYSRLICSVECSDDFSKMDPF